MSDRRLFLPALLLLIALSACTGACGGQRAAPPGADALAAALADNPAATPAFTIPLPAQYLRQGSASGGAHRDGADFEALLCANVSPSGSGAQFNPAWNPGDDPSGLAYAVYRFAPAGGLAQGCLELGWDGEPEYWLGLGDPAANCWRWSAAPGPSGLLFDPAACRMDDDSILLAVVATGHSAGTLDTLDIETPSAPGPLRKLFFLHHSTGWGIISEGDLRGAVADYNSAQGESFEFWDQGYNGDGVYDQAGNWYEVTYPVPNDNTDPDGLHYLWTSPNADATACRNGLLGSYDVIAFKSCFPASAIYDGARLEQYKQWYLDIRETLDAHPDKLFVVLSTPPLRPEETNSADAARARQFAQWLKSPAYLSGHPNIVGFDLFDALAADSGPEANMLRSDYRRPDSGDSHPNEAANAAVGPPLAQFMIDAALAYAPPG